MTFRDVDTAAEKRKYVPCDFCVASAATICCASCLADAKTAAEARGEKRGACVWRKSDWPTNCNKPTRVAYCAEHYEVLKRNRNTAMADARREAAGQLDADQIERYDELAFKVLGAASVRDVLMGKLVMIRRTVTTLSAQNGELVALLKRPMTNSTCVDHDDPGCWWCQTKEGDDHKDHCEARAALAKAKEVDDGE